MSCKAKTVVFIGKAIVCLLCMDYKDFENAYLFKTKHGAEQRKKLPCYSKCTIKEVELKLVEK